jgi:hypothetical protein
MPVFRVFWPFSGHFHKGDPMGGKNPQGIGVWAMHRSESAESIWNSGNQE